jgi:hypothetical protein
MFKKTLIAVALATLSTGAMAVNVDSSTTYTYGAEALNSGAVKNDFTALLLNEVTLTLGAAYSVGDLIKINISGATFKTTDAFVLVTDGTAAEIKTGFLTATANQLVFRVTEVTAATAGRTLTLAATSKIKLDSTVAGTKVTVSASAETSTGVAIDVTGTTDSKVVGTVIQQHKFAAGTQLLNEKIDVADERKALTALFDTADVEYTYTAPTFAATDFDITTGNGLTLKAKGSFTGFETGVTGSTALGAVTIDAVAATVATDLQSGSAALARPAATDTLPVTFTPNAIASSRAVLNASSYLVDAKISNGTVSYDYNDIAIGSLVLNGANKTFGYVPVNFDGAVVSQFEIGNKGTVDGEITITAFDRDGVKHSAVLPFKAAAGKMTKLSDDDISTAFGLTKGASLNLTITVNAPSTEITISGYSNRGTTGRMSLSAVN